MIRHVPYESLIQQSKKLAMLQNELKNEVTETNRTGEKKKTLRLLSEQVHVQDGGAMAVLACVLSSRLICTCIVQWNLINTSWTRMAVKTFCNDCVVHTAENTNTMRCRLHEELQRTVKYFNVVLKNITQESFGS